MYEYKALITNIVDGDTVDAEIDLGFDIVHKIRIRLEAINAPESRTRDLVEKAAGLEAARWLSSQILGKEVFITTSKTGKFGRYIAYLYHSQTGMECRCTEATYNQEMLDLGLAVPYGEKWVSGE